MLYSTHLTNSGNKVNALVRKTWPWTKTVEMQKSIPCLLSLVLKWHFVDVNPSVSSKGGYSVWSYLTKKILFAENSRDKQLQFQGNAQQMWLPRASPAKWLLQVPHCPWQVNWTGKAPSMGSRLSHKSQHHQSEMMNIKLVPLSSLRCTVLGH